MKINRIGILVLSLFFSFLSVSFPALAKPIFLGLPSQIDMSARMQSKLIPVLRERVGALSFQYMTADLMAEKVRLLTGFWQPGFMDFGLIIGILNPVTGKRTNDRPTVMSVMVMETLATEVADSVYARESFLDDEDRIVLKGMDLLASPSDSEISGFLGGVCISWFNQECPAGFVVKNIEKFRSDEATSNGGGIRRAWVLLMSALLQNGVLYYF